VTPSPHELDPSVPIGARWAAHGLPGSTDHLALTSTLERARRVVDMALEGTLKPFGLTRARYELLLRLYYDPSGSQQLGKLGDLLLVHPTSITSLVDRLEKAGLVQRRMVPDDRRAILAEITSDGRRIVEKAAEALADMDFGVGGISRKDATELRKLLMKIVRLRGDTSP
jgi:DNA-binding MarR family transcriptional regulator